MRVCIGEIVCQEFPVNNSRAQCWSDFRAFMREKKQQVNKREAVK